MRHAGIAALHWQLCRLLTRFEDSARAEPDGLVLSVDQRSWACFADLANRSLVTPAVWPALQRSNLMGPVPLPYQDYFRAAFDWNAARNAAIQDELVDVISALNERSIIPVLLKGAAYIMDGSYRTPGARILGDADILVEADKGEVAVQVLRDLGYASAGWPGRNYDQHHHVEPLKNPKRQAYVEIHREVLAEPFTIILPASQIFSGARMCSANGAEFAVPSPTHAATISFAHSEIIDGCDALARINIRSLMDMARLHRRYGDSIDWGDMLSVMRSNGLQGPLRNYFYSLEKLAGIELVSQSPASVRQKMHYWLMNKSLQFRWLEKLLTILDELSEQRLRERHVLNSEGRSVHSLRVRHLAFIFRRFLFRSTDRAS